MKLIVHLTRVQVHRLFPRVARDFPWFTERVDRLSGNIVIDDHRQRLETWHVPITTGDS
jgi:hypothetical protein